MVFDDLFSGRVTPLYRIKTPKQNTNWSFLWNNTKRGKMYQWYPRDGFFLVVSLQSGDIKLRNVRTTNFNNHLVLAKNNH